MLIDLQFCPSPSQQKFHSDDRGHSPSPLPTPSPSPFPQSQPEDTETSLFSRRKLEILKGISIYFNPGELIGIMGPSGQYQTSYVDSNPQATPTLREKKRIARKPSSTKLDDITRFNLEIRIVKCTCSLRSWAEVDRM